MTNRNSREATTNISEISLDFMIFLDPNAAGVVRREAT
jgi:hypothetical protein